MAVRGVIIAIENYPLSRGEVAGKVAGAAQAGLGFARWLTAAKGVPASQLYVCADAPGYDAAVRRYGTEREQIIDAVADLVADGQDQTEELYVFFSGHGFTFQDAPDRRAVGILLGSDFESAADSGTKCIDLAEMQTKLWAILGGLHHYYFVDACRNVLNMADIEPVPFGRRLGRVSQRGRPTRYTLYSAHFGQEADIESPFAGALLEGLNGRGRAKGYTADQRLFVMFPRLKEFVEEQMEGRQIDQAHEGDGEGLILQIQPIPKYKGRIEVEDAAASDTFKMRLWPAANADFVREESFTGGTHEFDYRPGDLIIEVTQDGADLDRVSPAVASFYDDCVLRFRQPEPAAFSPVFATEPAATLSVRFETFTLPEVVLERPAHQWTPAPALPPEIAVDAAMRAMAITTLTNEECCWLVVTQGREGVREELLTDMPGFRPIPLAVDGRAEMTVASWGLAGRVTVVAAETGDRGPLSVVQFMVPPHHLSPALPYELQPPSPQKLRAMRDYQLRLASGRPVEPAGANERAEWLDILHAKWLDPVTSLVVCYDVIRRGDPALRESVRTTVVDNLNRHFAGLPDTAAIAELLGRTGQQMPEAPPLFTDALYAFPDWLDALPFPEGRLDHGSLFTTWRSR